MQLAEWSGVRLSSLVVEYRTERNEVTNEVRSLNQMRSPSEEMRGEVETQPLKL